MTHCEPPQKRIKESGLAPMLFKFFYALYLSLGYRTIKGDIKSTWLYIDSAQKSKQTHESHRKLAIKLLFKKIQKVRTFLRSIRTCAEGPYFCADGPHFSEFSANCGRSALFCGGSAQVRRFRTCAEGPHFPENNS